MQENNQKVDHLLSYLHINKRRNQQEQIFAGNELCYYRKSVDTFWKPQ